MSVRPVFDHSNVQPVFIKSKVVIEPTRNLATCKKRETDKWHVAHPKIYVRVPRKYQISMYVLNVYGI